MNYNELENNSSAFIISYYAYRHTRTPMHKTYLNTAGQKEEHKRYLGFILCIHAAKNKPTQWLKPLDTKWKLFKSTVSTKILFHYIPVFVKWTVLIEKLKVHVSNGCNTFSSSFNWKMKRNFLTSWKTSTAVEKYKNRKEKK